MIAEAPEVRLDPIGHGRLPVLGEDERTVQAGRREAAGGDGGGDVAGAGRVARGEDTRNAWGSAQIV